MLCDASKSTYLPGHPFLVWGILVPSHDEHTWNELEQIGVEAT